MKQVSFEAGNKYVDHRSILMMFGKVIVKLRARTVKFVVEVRSRTNL